MKIGYARVSTPDQKLDMQRDALEAAGCERIYQDRGVSGASASRPGLDKALESLSKGDVLVVWKLDRLGRSVANLADLLRRFHEEGIEFRSLSEAIDTTTMSGKLVYHIFSAVGEFERELIRERTLNGIRAAKARGTHTGRPRALSDREVRAAYERIRAGRRPLAWMAARLGVNQSTLSRAFRRLDLPV